MIAGMHIFAVVVVTSCVAQLIVPGAFGRIGGAIPKPKNVIYQNVPSHPAQSAVKSGFKVKTILK